MRPMSDPNLKPSSRENAAPASPTRSGTPSAPPNESDLDWASRMLREGCESFNRERFPDGTLRNPPKSSTPSKSTQELVDLVVRAAEIADEEQEELEARIRALRSAPSVPPDDSTEE